MNLSVLIHTFNGYKHLWKGCIESARHRLPVGAMKYFGTDIETDFDTEDWQKLYSGTGEWSDRLIRLIEQIPTDYVLYLQEDHYIKCVAPDAPVYGFPDVDHFVRHVMPENDIWRLQISPVNQFYQLTGQLMDGNGNGNLLLHFHPKSKYLVSHQPSIWKKSFLLECLKPGETPWVNEYEGTKRLQKREDLTGKIAIYPYDWYDHVCVKGVVQQME